MTKKPRMIFDLPDDERDVLERVRVKLGLRSHAEALRFLIRQENRTPTRSQANAPSRR
jgi:hypothetical protein